MSAAPAPPAAGTIAAGPVRTPVMRLAPHGWGALYVKDETRQVSGAFKYRGSWHRLAGLPPGTRLVTASTGNHALGLAIAAAQAACPLTVHLPQTTPQAKAGKVADHAAEIVCVDGDYDDCEAAARSWAARSGALFVHSFDDAGVVTGHRSLYREVREQVGLPDRAFVPVGGGGLVSAGLLEWGGGRIVGVEYAAAPALRESLARGRRVVLDEAAGMPEGLLVRRVGEIAFSVCSRHDLPVATVDDAAIGRAMRLLWQEAGIRAEGAGAAALAAAVAAPDPAAVAVCVVSGGNVDQAVWRRCAGIDDEPA